jgi:hypothetical protein
VQFLVLVLIGVFIVGGTGLGETLLRRPFVLLAVSAAIGAAFYSLRIVQ